MTDPYASPSPYGSQPYTGSSPAVEPEPPDRAPRAYDEDHRSVGEIFGDISKDVSTLMRQEVALAKAEVQQSASRAGKGIGMLVAAGVAGLLFLIFISVALWWALGSTAIGRGWAAVIVAVIWAIIGGILFAAGRSALQKIRGIPETTDTVSKIPTALKGKEEENR